ncbi:MAG: alpha/beta hydrolase [Alphaproteobacteria bacterium]|nr:alpha/beta hydrolase [Alphaproteobacteria bacterium]
MTDVVPSVREFERGANLDRLTRLHALPCGRRLAYLELGDPQGKPCFYFHGFPGSRLEPAILDVAGLRLIAVDRPGYGRSEPCAGRGLLDWPKDVASLADALGLARFSVIGVSGGAPYAAACAYALGARVAAAAVICGLGPPDAPGMDTFHIRLLQLAGSNWPTTSRALLSVWRPLVLRGPVDMLQTRLRARNPRGSKEWAALSPDFAGLILASWREGMRYSADGMLSDGAIYGAPWGFSLADIKTRFLIWHGTADTTVPVSIGHYYAAHIRHADARFPVGEGHFSLVRNHILSMTAAIAVAS